MELAARTASRVEAVVGGEFVHNQNNGDRAVVMNIGVAMICLADYSNGA